MRKGKKIAATVLIVGVFLLGGAGNVLAQPNGYYVDGTEYLFTDVVANPGLFQTINSGLGGSLSHLALDLGGHRADYGDYLTYLKSTGQAASDISFYYYAGLHPYMVPAGSTVYNPHNPGEPIVNVDAPSGTLSVVGIS